MSCRRRFCLGLGAFAATLNFRAAANQVRRDDDHNPAPQASDEPALLERPATGLGSLRLVDVAIRQEAKIYKVTPQGNLAAYVFYPPDWKAQDRRPACGFFFGGGWRTG